MYEIVGPDGNVPPPPEGRCWSTIESEFMKLREAGRIWSGKDGKSQPNTIRYLSEVGGMVPWTWWSHDEVGHTDEAKKEIQDLFKTQTAFDTPNPTRLLEHILQIATNPGDLVLDSFAGSGTTGHAVLKMNATDRRLGLWPDNGPADILSAEREEAGQDARADADGPEAHPPGRRFIVVEMEPVIAKTITAERVKRVAEGYTNAKGVRPWRAWAVASATASLASPSLMKRGKSAPR